MRKPWPGDPAQAIEVGANYFAAWQLSTTSPGAREALDGIQAVLEGRLPGFCMEYPCHSPTQQRWFTMDVTPLGQNSQKGAVITHSNITRIKLAEEQSRQLLAENQTLLRNALVGIVHLKQRRIVSCNRRFEEIFHYAPGTLTGESTERLYDTHANFLALGKRIFPALSEGKNFSEELLLRHRDGSLFWGAINGCAIDPEQPDAGSIWIYTDISARRRVEQELEIHQSHLEELVLQRTAELTEALKAARMADLAKDEFLANITHELRTPLSAVLGFSSLARPFCTDPRQRDYLDKVNSAGKTLGSIINDLLDLSKIVAGRLEFEAKPFSLRQLVVRCNAVIGYQAEEKGLSLCESIDEQIPDFLLGDSLRIEQILLNLLSNAIKFTTSGRVELRVGLQQRTAQRVCLKIEVEDTGIGLNAAEIAQMFKPFSQADASITRKFGGTGLGLAICKRLTELMDGEIGVSSQVGQGTTFWLTLWLDLAAASESPIATATEYPATVPLHYQDVRVLVVDDQPFNREIVQGLLAVVGITPQLASDGQQALDLIAMAEPAFDLVLMDIQMPVMDGLTATRAIRRQGCGARLPIIAMTAHTMAHEKGKSILAGMNDHIGKPFDEADFYRVLSKWMPHGKQQPPMVASPPPQPTPTSGEKQGRAQEGEGEEAAASTFPLLHGIDTQAGMALLLGNEARYRHWLIDFMAKTPATLTQIRRDLANDDAKSAIMATHSLRGRMGLLGMKDLHVTATALEMAIESATEAATESTTNCAATNDEDNHELNALLLALEQSVMAICAEIQRGFGLDNSGAPPSAPWSEAVGPLLAEGVPTENGRA